MKKLSGGMPLTIFYKKGIYVQFSSDNTIESNTAESRDEDGMLQRSEHRH
jgi:hypothetical protein